MLLVVITLNMKVMEKTLSIKEYLNEIKPYLSDMINDLKTQGKWKIQLTTAIYFFSSKNSKERHTMHTKSNNIEIIIDNERTFVIEDGFVNRSLKSFWSLC